MNQSECASEIELYEVELEHIKRRLAELKGKKKSPLDPFYWLEYFFDKCLALVEYAVTAIVEWVLSKIPRKRR